MTVSFSVLGTPISQGSKRHVGGGRMIESANLRPWRQAVAWEAKIAAKGHVFRGPVNVSICFYLRRPKKPQSPYPDRKPDMDKLIRAIFDGLTDGGVWEDDARCVILEAGKFYCNDLRKEPCVLITMEDVL